MTSASVSLIDLMASESDTDAFTYVTYRRMIDTGSLAEDIVSMEWDSVDGVEQGKETEFATWVEDNREAIDYLLMSQFPEALNDALNDVFNGCDSYTVYWDSLLPLMGTMLLSMWNGVQGIKGGGK